MEEKLIEVQPLFYSDVFIMKVGTDEQIKNIKKQVEKK